MLLIIDNYDSFTYNLFQYLSELGQEVRVARNDKISLEEIEAMSPERIVISPGPSTPLHAGISNDVIKHFGDRLPVLGVCLGHQCVGHSYGGVFGPAKTIMHGKSSLIYHNGGGHKGNKTSLPFERAHAGDGSFRRPDRGISAASLFAPGKIIMQHQHYVVTA